MAASGSRFIFLDVDGVLVSRRCLDLEFDNGDESLIFAEGLGYPLERACVERLAQIQSDTKAVVVRRALAPQG